MSENKRSSIGVYVPPSDQRDPKTSPRKPLTLQRGQQHYFIADEDLIAPKHFEHQLKFQYKGDVFAQRGNYADASLYMSRLPQTRKTSTLRHKAGANYKMQVRLAPMPQQPTVTTALSAKLQSISSSKSGRKLQYALAIEAMAANPNLHANLLSENVIPSILALCRTKDIATLASCVTTLCYLSCEAAGRESIINHNALALLVNAVEIASQDKWLVANALATLANLTIEDTLESTFIKEKGLESLVKNRKTYELGGRFCTFALFNLTCPAYSYPRVDDVIHGLIEHGKEGQDREILSRAFYNLSCTRMNQPKLIDPESIMMLNLLAVTNHSDPVCLNALAALWHLAESATCRRAMIRPECIRLLVDQLVNCNDEKHLMCALSILSNLSREPMGRELMGFGKALDALAALSQRAAKDIIRLVSYRLMAVILSASTCLPYVSDSFFYFLLSFRHDLEEQDVISRYVLFALASILSWNDQEDRYLVEANMPDATPLLKEEKLLHLDSLLDDPGHLNQIYTHVVYPEFVLDSREVYLQMLLLYNLSFRYNKVDVANLAWQRLHEIGKTAHSIQILVLLCGILFSLSQEYDVHPILFNMDTIQLLERMARHCETETQCTCLEVVCIAFDGRKLMREYLVELVTKMFPVLEAICSTGNASLRAACAACFTRFAMIEECRLFMVQHGLIGSLAILAGEEDAQTLRLCVHTYSFLSHDPQICSTLIHNGIIKSLTYLAAAPEEAVRRECAMTLCNLSTAEENIAALVKYGALRALLVISCVKSNEPETRRICMKGVMNLLRLPANLAQMCQDGLLWAFGIFTSAMELKDYDIIADAFCTLAFYPATRKDIVKAPILNAFFRILTSPVTPNSTKVKVLKGISNLLCDPSIGYQLIQLNILAHLIPVIHEQSHQDLEIRSLITQILMLLFQSCPEAEAGFSQDTVIKAIAELLHGERESECERSCAMLLLLMSMHEQTRAKLVQKKEIMDALSQLLLHASQETDTLLIRCIYNITCDVTLLPLIPVRDIVPSLAVVVQKYYYSPSEISILTAAILRNFSCQASCHNELMTDTASMLLTGLFDVESEICKEDLAICTCNLLLGKINSHFLLSRSVLPLILWLCGNPRADTRAMCSAALRKLAIAPGNIQTLVDGGIISQLVLLMQHPSSTYVKWNCVATFCLLSQKPGVPTILSSYGVLSLIIERVEDCATSTDHVFENMCVDLLLTLAEFARADDPRESRVSSVLYQLMERGESTPNDRLVWQNDRTFLERRDDCQNDEGLSTASLSKAHVLSQNKLPTLRHTPYLTVFPGYTVEFTQAANHIEVRTIEPIIPNVSLLDEPITKNSSCVIKQVVTSVPFKPPAMYEKMRTPFAPITCTSTGTNGVTTGVSDQI